MAKMTEKHYYQAQIGTAEFSWFGNCDRSARQKVARWIRRNWLAFVASSRPGSMAFTVNRENPDVCIVRRYIDNPADVVPCTDPVFVDSFILDDVTFAEFCRVSGVKVKCTKHATAQRKTT